MSIFFLPKKIMDSERVQELISFMNSDIQGFYDYMEYLYSYISVDEADSDYIQDISSFLGLETLKFKYSEANEAKAIKNYYGLVKYIGGVRPFNIVLATYKVNVELKYLWTNDFVFFEELDITDILYGQDKKKYLTSVLIVRFILQFLVQKTFDVVSNLVDSSDLDDYIEYYKTSFFRINEQLIVDPIKGSGVMSFQPTQYAKSVYIFDLDNVFTDIYMAYLAGLSINSSVALKVRGFNFLETLSEYPKQIFQGTTNLVSDPEDLTTANWTEVNATATLSDLYYDGKRFTKVSNDGAASRFVYQSYTDAWTTTTPSFSVILRKGSSIGNTTRFKIYNLTNPGDVFNIIIDWDNYPNAPGIADAGILHGYDWKDSETLELRVICDVIALNDDLRIYCYASDNATAGEYTYWTAVQAEDLPYSTPYVNGSRSDVNIDKAFQLPPSGKFTIDMIIEPWFIYDTAILHHSFLWRIDAAHFFQVRYVPSVDKFLVGWMDGGTTRYLYSQQFDDGLSFTKLNQRLRIIVSIDISIGGITTGSRLIVIPQESGAIFEDISWSGIIDVLSSTFPTHSIGHESSANYVDSQYEYERIYDDTLVGVITSNEDADALLAVKTQLFEYPSRSYSSWQDISASFWQDFLQSVEEPLGYLTKGIGWEMKKSDGSQFAGTEVIKAFDPIWKKNYQNVLMESELYLNLKADLNRFKMSQQILDYQCRLALTFSKNTTGWYEIYDDIWVWIDVSKIGTLILADSGFIADDNLVADYVPGEDLENFFKCKFGAEASEPGGSVQDVAAVIISKDGVVTLNVDLKSYKLQIYLEDETFDYVSEMAVRDSLDEVFLYFIFPIIEKTGDKIYFNIDLDFS